MANGVDKTQGSNGVEMPNLAASKVQRSDDRYFNDQAQDLRIQDFCINEVMCRTLFSEATNTALFSVSPDQTDLSCLTLRGFNSWFSLPVFFTDFMHQCQILIEQKSLVICKKGQMQVHKSCLTTKEQEKARAWKIEGGYTIKASVTAKGKLLKESLEVAENLICLEDEQYYGEASRLQAMLYPDCSISRAILSSKDHRSITVANLELGAEWYHGKKLNLVLRCWLLAAKHFSLSQCNLKYKGMQWLEYGRALEKLDICDVHAESAEAGENALVAALQFNMPRLQCLNLRKWRIGDNAGVKVALALKQHAALKELELSGCFLGSATVAALAEALNRLNRLEKLAVGGEVLNGKEGANFIQALEKNVALKNLDLSECGIDDAVTKELATVLKVLRQLERLWLPNNKIGPQGACSLAAALKVHPKVTVFNIANNPFGQEGMLAFSELIESASSRLKELNLNGRLLEKDKASGLTGHFLAEALNKNRRLGGRLKSIVLNQEFFANEGGLGFIFDSLIINGGLTRCEMYAERGHQLTEADGRALAILLQSNGTLTCLRLNCLVSKQVSDSFLSAMQSNLTLTDFTLSDVKSDDTETQAVCQHVQKHLKYVKEDPKAEEERKRRQDIIAQAFSEQFIGRASAVLTLLKEQENRLEVVHLGMYADKGGYLHNEREGYAQAIKENLHVHTLTLTDCLLAPEWGKHLAEILRDNSVITELDVSVNSLGDAGIVSIAGALHTNCTLKVLRIAHQYIPTKAGVHVISTRGSKEDAKATVKIQSQMKAKASGPSLGEESAKALNEALAKNNTLQLLDISYNSLTDASVSQIVRGLQNNHSKLLTLSTFGNTFGPLTREAAFTALSLNHTLRSVTYTPYDTGIDSKEFEKMRAILMLVKIDEMLKANATGERRHIAIKEQLLQHVLDHSDCTESDLKERELVESDPNLRQYVTYSNWYYRQKKLIADISTTGAFQSTKEFPQTALEGAETAVRSLPLIGGVCSAAIKYLAAVKAAMDSRAKQNDASRTSFSTTRLEQQQPAAVTRFIRQLAILQKDKLVRSDELLAQVSLIDKLSQEFASAVRFTAIAKKALFDIEMAMQLIAMDMSHEPKHIAQLIVESLESSKKALASPRSPTPTSPPPKTGKKSG